MNDFINDFTDCISLLLISKLFQRTAPSKDILVDPRLLDTLGSINKVQVLQNQLLKVLTEKPYRYRTNKLHNELKILKVEDLYKQEILTFVHNFQNNKLPPVFDSYFTRFSNIHNINTRNRNTNFILPIVSSTRGSTSISFEGAVLWNNLDNLSKEIKSGKSFRRSFKETVLPYPET